MLHKDDLMEFLEEDLNLNEFISKHFNKIACLSENHPLKDFVKSLHFIIVDEYKEDILNNAFGPRHFLQILLNKLDKMKKANEHYNESHRRSGDSDRSTGAELNEAIVLGTDFVNQIYLVYADKFKKN